LVDRNPVHALQSREHFRPKAFQKRRPARTLVDEIVACDGNDQNISQAASRLEVAYVAQMEQVESAVRVYNGLTSLAQPSCDRSELLDRSDLVTRVCCNPRRRPL
jgi:hypothetical protein